MHQCIEIRNSHALSVNYYTKLLKYINMKNVSQHLNLFMHYCILVVMQDFPMRVIILSVRPIYVYIL